MPTVTAIKTSIKTLLDATSSFGSVYTEDRLRIEKPMPAYITMFHSGGEFEPQSNTLWERTTQLLLSLIVLQPPTAGEVLMQTTMDTKLQALLDAINDDPTLSGTVMLCFPKRYDIDYEEPDPEKRRAGRLVCVLALDVTYEED